MLWTFKKVKALFRFNKSLHTCLVSFVKKTYDFKGNLTCKL